MMASKLSLFIAAVFVARAAKAQAAPVTPTPLTFEVSTVKPSAGTGWSMHPTPSGYSATGVSLRQLVREAFDAYDEKLLSGGPDWTDSDKFDLEAKLGDEDVAQWKNLSYRQRADILRPLLAERFHLRVHYVSKLFPVYKLVIAAGGPKLQATALEKRDDLKSTVTCYVVQNRRGYTQRRDCLVASLTGELRYATGRSIIDDTGLTGRYDFELRWTPENATSTETDQAVAPSIFTALQEQLGLKLEPGTAPLQILVIDHADRPTEN